MTPQPHEEQNLERLLRDFPPAPLPETLQQNLLPPSAHPKPLPFADRLLITFAGAGALAACIIVTVITLQVLRTPDTPSPRMASPQDQELRELYGTLATR